MHRWSGRRGHRARAQHIFLEDLAVTVDFGERYVVAPELGKVLQHARDGRSPGPELIAVITSAPQPTEVASPRR